MSINAINSLSLYEYYYKINRDDQAKKKSPLEKEMREYGLTPTDNDDLNIAMLEQAKRTKKMLESQNQKEELSPSDRPWADLMYQLNIPFNEDPNDDIQDIKDELAQLIQGIDDKELEQEVKDLENYVENLYISFNKNQTSRQVDGSSLIYSQLNNLSMLNQANFT
ncbi:MAG: hypothetical protein IJ003_01275 [Candidatus Gastranaerophilales bacterium]|nr:hypothetical protein [Candidatus Gastranaerophilales bacterium]